MTSGSWQTAGFCAVGYRHLQRGQPCQDALLTGSRRYEHGEVLAMAVADGHGSSTHAEVGARMAVETAVEILLDFYDALLLELHESRDAGSNLTRILELAMSPTRRQLVQAWAAKVGQHTGTPDGQMPSVEVLKAYGTTLLMVLVAPEFVLFGQIGDGDLLRIQPDGDVIRPLMTDPRSFADETASLCQQEAWLQLRMAIHPPLSSECLLLLSTDGYANSYEDDATFERIGPDYLTLIRRHGLQQVDRALPAFLERVSREGCGDDVTLALLYLAPPLEQKLPLQAPAAPEMGPESESEDVPQEHTGGMDQSQT